MVKHGLNETYAKLIQYNCHRHLHKKHLYFFLYEMAGLLLLLELLTVLDMGNVVDLPTLWICLRVGKNVVEDKQPCPLHHKHVFIANLHVLHQTGCPAV